MDEIGPHTPAPSPRQPNSARPTGVVARAREMHRKLQSIDFLLQATADCEGAVAKASPPALGSLRRLSNLLRRLRTLPGCEERASKASKTLQDALVACHFGSKQNGQTAAADTDAEAIQELADTVFNNLLDFSRLKNAQEWRGHTMWQPTAKTAGRTRSSILRRRDSRRESIATRRDSATSRRSIRQGDGLRRTSTAASSALDLTSLLVAGGEMLSHARTGILESLTQVPESWSKSWLDVEMYENAAVQNFHNVLVCMGDTAAQECQRLSSRSAIMALVASDVVYREEIYVQLMKQLTGNASKRSVELGWELMWRLCEQAPPAEGTELFAYVRAFVSEALPRLDSAGPWSSRQSPDAASVHARACLSALDRTRRRAKGSWMQSFMPASTWELAPTMECCFARGAAVQPATPRSQTAPSRHLDFMKSPRP
eukprot:TRINITY_DN5948_c1_g3_i1.p1 TRINITY_DN5948_c1_g3~~TRINITY_DN5948_c1_g3_i1.p1  ORF type:complete len:429 (+),score=87.97 TRINITY_DN5948_c1_g3_i1:241-1527(+)